MHSTAQWRDNMVLPNDLPDGSAILAAVGALFTGVFYMRKRFSRLEKTRVEAEVDLIKTLQEERDKARLGEAEARGREDAAWRARNEDAKMIGQLTSEVRHFQELSTKQQEQIVEMTKQITLLRNEVHSLRDKLNEKELMEQVQNKGL